MDREREHYADHDLPPPRWPRVVFSLIVAVLTIAILAAVGAVAYSLAVRMNLD